MEIGIELGIGMGIGMGMGMGIRISLWIVMITRNETRVLSRGQDPGIYVFRYFRQLKDIPVQRLFTVGYEQCM